MDTDVILSSIPTEYDKSVPIQVYLHIPIIKLIQISLWLEFSSFIFTNMIHVEDYIAYLFNLILDNNNEVDTQAIVMVSI